jgi:hypothetical protein
MYSLMWGGYVFWHQIPSGFRPSIMVYNLEGEKIKYMPHVHT